MTTTHKKSAWEKYLDQKYEQPAGWSKSFEQVLNIHLKQRTYGQPQTYNRTSNPTAKSD